MKIIVLMEDTCGNPECSAEHGLSVYIETKHHKLLADTGSSDAFIRNAEKLNVDLTQVDTVILSHGHYDHAGGLLAFEQRNPRASIYMKRTAAEAYYHGERYIGIDRRIPGLSKVKMLGGNYKIDEELFLFTNITGRRRFAESNFELSKLVKGKLQQDPFDHEQCLVITGEDKKVLISGCAHNGILNILDKYRQLYGGEPDVVISGFHMMKKEEYTNGERDAICATAKELAAMDTVFYTGHCTGQKAIDLMKPIMGEKLVQIHSGTRIM